MRNKKSKLTPIQALELMLNKTFEPTLEVNGTEVPYDAPTQRDKKANFEVVSSYPKAS